MTDKPKTGFRKARATYPDGTPIDPAHYTPEVRAAMRAMDLDSMRKHKIEGLRGPVGERGPRGKTGEQGPIGLRGAQGDMGWQGDKGDPGNTPEVLNGPRAPKPEDGKNGDLWINTFPQGRSSLYKKAAGMWTHINDLKGPRGPSGPQGLSIRGEKGVKGDTGPQGTSPVITVASGLPPDY